LVNLHFECTNNTVEKKACIIGLKATLKLKIKKIDVYGDSMLIICQVKGGSKIKKEKLRCYQQYLSKVAKMFEEIEFTHLGREGNWFVDAVAILVVTTRIDFEYKVQPVQIDIQNFLVYGCSVEREIDGNP
jgi:ribonuclease HI